ncbi:hypothetical protein [Kaistia terrae]|uniref:Uncharacterized protein n=1 Tax=Kaistia terrae TaxID=537017 RepID=A0ABW0PZE2_9HYPH|nr:hypothetical protein [Kaistia terrae]MCX5580253.1 hypothetical protein [Kaistia terrae]
MNSAKERAVEAGARAIARYDQGNDIHWQLYTFQAEAVLRAGIAIELEELAQKVEQMYRPHIGRHEMEERAAKVIAAALRARIQQMAEAEHE